MLVVDASLVVELALDRIGESAEPDSAPSAAEHRSSSWRR
jgi:hypothetical protein